MTLVLCDEHDEIDLLIGRKLIRAPLGGFLFDLRVGHGFYDKWEVSFVSERQNQNHRFLTFSEFWFNQNVRHVRSGGSTLGSARACRGWSKSHCAAVVRPSVELSRTIDRNGVV